MKTTINTTLISRTFIMVAFTLLLSIFWMLSCESGDRNSQEGNIPEGSKMVVLTFDDAVKSHRTFVAPLLEELGFGATFFITYEWMEDTVNFLTWEEVAELHEMGFEIGNHSWHHWDFSQPRTAAMLEGELGLVNWQLMQVGVPKPVSFAWNGNAFGPESLEVLEEQGIVFARRGKQPEVPYGEVNAGPGYDPMKHHPLLIPTTIDAYPGVDLEHFISALESVDKKTIPVIQFHGVPDPVHPWVSTTQEKFLQFMDYLKSNNYRVIAMRDLAEFIPEHLPEDPMLTFRHTLKKDTLLDWPEEVIATRNNLDYWLHNMHYDHHFTRDEMMEATGYGLEELDKELSSLQPPEEKNKQKERIKVRPYPGIRHPRINFKEGMLSPMRGTKASIFLPWDPAEYVVLDLPEALFSQLGLTFLGHKHIPTIFDYQKTVITNSDWRVDKDGNLFNTWELPNKLTIGAEIYPGVNEVGMKLWLKNDTDSVFTGLQSQVCVMLKMASQFNTLTNDNKIFDAPVAAVHSVDSSRWIITAWNNGNHEWGNADCPCIHSDPRLPDCRPGETVSVTGRIWFYNGTDIEGEIGSIKNQFGSFQK